MTDTTDDVYVEMYIFFAPERFEMAHRIIKNKIKCSWYFIQMFCLCSVWTMVYRLHVDTLLLFVLLLYSSFVKGYFQFDHTKLKLVECRYSDTKIYFGENFC